MAKKHYCIANHSTTNIIALVCQFSQLLFLTIFPNVLLSR
uniref:Uncharacterized protein n=1 Tax=Anguilla anguilla TaxID=7936 RepID=A0A0E9SE44_ANGAN